MSGGVTLRSKHAPQRLRTELPLLNMKDPQKTVWYSSRVGDVTVRARIQSELAFPESTQYKMEACRLYKQQPKPPGSFFIRLLYVDRVSADQYGIREEKYKNYYEKGVVGIQ